MRTYVSCQGNVNHGPSIEFVGGVEAVQKVHTLMESWVNKYSHNYTHNIIIGYAGKREKGDDAWSICMYDTLSLIEFNRDVLWVSVQDQIYNYLPTPSKKMTVEEMKSKMTFADAKEIENILALDHYVG